MHRPPGLVGSIALLLAAIIGCGGSDLVLPGDGTPAELRLERGNNQIGPAGAALPDSLEVRVVDDRGAPVPGYTVSFELDSDAPGAQVLPQIATSRSDGTARALWILGATSGTQNVVARVDRRGDAEPLEARFSATVGAAGAQQIAVASGNEQSGPVGGLLANPLAVRVTDQFGNPVEGITVEWEAQNGSVDPALSVTGTDGLAGTSWTLSSSTGSQSVTASAGGLNGSPVTFTAIALAGTPTRLERVSGNDQSGAPGAVLASPLVVRLVDGQGNGVPGRPVTWVVATGGGTPSPTTSTTDENGRASTAWTLGPEEGGNTLNAVASGVAQGVVAFTADATGPGGGGGGGGGSQNRLVFRVQPSDTDEGETMSPAVQVAVVDQSGDLVTDREFEIKLELLDDHDKVKAEGTAPTQSGVATFTIRIDRKGKYRLRASTDGLPSVRSDRFEVDD